MDFLRQTKESCVEYYWFGVRYLFQAPKVGLLDFMVHNEAPPQWDENNLGSQFLGLLFPAEEIFVLRTYQRGLWDLPEPSDIEVSE